MKDGAPGAPCASVIILNYNGRHLLNDCLGSLGAQSFSDFEACVVDNGSADGSVEFIQNAFPWVRVFALEDGRWVQRPALRVPLGPGTDGKLNALALSQDAGTRRPLARGVEPRSGTQVQASHSSIPANPLGELFTEGDYQSQPSAHVLAASPRAIRPPS